jgi:hypothetical protein
VEGHGETRAGDGENAQGENHLQEEESALLSGKFKLQI